MTSTRRTALITGASSGLGAEFARRMASDGFDLILVARRLDRLDALSRELESAHGIMVRNIKADLARPNAAAALAQEVGETQIHTLVNNAGFGHIGPFVNENLNAMGDEIALNVGTLTQLTRIYLPKMIERGEGAVINVASTAAYQPIPNMAVYGATKAYVLSFTEAIWGETRGTGVNVLAVSPGPTETEFFGVAEGKSIGKTMATPAEVIDTALAAVARGTHPSVIVGRKNSIQAAVAKIVPRKMVLKVAGNMMKSDLAKLDEVDPGALTRGPR